MTATLLTDIYSHFKRADKKDFVLYGSKGEKVNIISDRGTVLIVESIKTKNRFPTLKESVLIKI